MLSNLNDYRYFYQLHRFRSKTMQIKLTIRLIIRLTLNQSQLFCDCLLNMCTRWMFLKTMSLDKFRHSQLFHKSIKMSQVATLIWCLSHKLSNFSSIFIQCLYLRSYQIAMCQTLQTIHKGKKITTIKRTESFYHQNHIVSLMLIVLGDLFRLRVRESIVCFDSKWLDGLDEKRIAHELCAHHILRWSMWTYWNIYIYLFYL